MYKYLALQLWIYRKMSTTLNKIQNFNLEQKKTVITKSKETKIPGFIQLGKNKI